MQMPNERLASAETGINFIRWFVGIAFAILIPVLVWYGSELFSLHGRVSSTETNIGNIQARISSIDASITTINKSLDEIRLGQAASSPKNKSSAAEAAKILDEALTKQIKFSPNVLESSGIRFIEAGSSSPDAWKTAQEYLGYRSFLNADFQPTLKDLTPSPTSAIGYHMSIHTRPMNYEPTKVALVYNAGGLASPKDDARLESLSGGIQKIGSGVKWLVVDLKSGDPLVLDDYYMRNVIVRNGTVDYDGGSVLLVNVFFVNCKFNFAPKPKAINLSRALLASAAVNFSDEGKSASVSTYPPEFTWLRRSSPANYFGDPMLAEKIVPIS
jgi:hypothetical protein